MTISAEIIKDSVSDYGKRITTFVLKYPRFIHGEIMSHRSLSRNASSSRAIPFNKQVQAIKDDMAMPISFRKNQPGMQSGEELSEAEQASCRYLWKESFNQVLKHAEDLHLFGVSKESVNRLLEPYSHITVICTATEYANFFTLRYHNMAQPEFCELAKQMWEAYQVSVPVKRPAGEWHLPFISDEEYVSVWNSKAGLAKLIRKSVACCARVSYLNHDSTKPTDEQNDALYSRLVNATPGHLSPAEHQATPLSWNDDQSGNFFGWQQYRKTLEGENITEFNGPLEGKV